MEGPVLVCTVEELLQNRGRKRLTVGGKDLFVVLHNGKVFALDSFCYHAGGPLHEGEIEEISKYSCIVCPWHKYKITLNGGEGLYHSIDPHDLKKPPKLRSKGIKQRCHAVTLQDNKVYITLSTESSCESDQYNTIKR